LISLTHAWFDRLASIVIPIFFPRVIVHDASRFPRHGAVLVFSNHPSTWADGILMTLALRRPMRFLVHASLYLPRARGRLLRLYGAFPIYHRDDTEALLKRNDDTVRACHAALDRGEVVVTFPEGTSSTDWRMRPFKTGTARIALGYLAGRADRHLAVVPVGLYYRERTAFRSEVEIAVGQPIDLTSSVADPPAGAHALTQRMFDSLSALVAQTSDPEIETLAKELLPIVLPERRSSETLARAQELVAALEWLRAAAPNRLAELWSRVKFYRGLRDRVRLSDPELREHAGERSVWSRVGLALLLAPLALAGWAIHWIPETLTKYSVRRYASESSRVAFGRVTAGFVLFPATYVLLGWLLWSITGRPHAQIAGFLVVAALLGFVSLAYREWVISSIRGLRRMWLERRAPDIVASARQARSAILAIVAEAQRDARRPIAVPANSRLETDP
jgi:1-acyl-sn-glycerol-3-phosphate acyltransferase